MKMGKLKKAGALLLSGCLVSGLLVIPASAQEAYPESLTSIESRFTSTEDLQHFNSYLMADRNVSDSAGAADTGYAQWKVENGALQRASAFGEWTSVAMLTLKDYKLQNFELELDYKDGTSYDWVMVAFRQLEENTFGMLDGAIAFFDTQGRAYVWGTDAHGGEQKGEPQTGYEETKGALRSMRVRVVGETVRMYMDGQEIKSFSLPDIFTYEGYISLQLGGNPGAQVERIKVTNLDAEGEPRPLGYMPTAVETVPGVTVAYGTGLDEALAQLPDTVQVVTDAMGLDPEGQVVQISRECAVQWACETYDGQKAGTYTFTGTLTMPDKFLVNPRNLTAKADVTVVPAKGAVLTKVETPADVEVTLETDEKNLKLPETVVAKDAEGNSYTCKVENWTSETYNARKTGSYIFTGRLVMPSDAVKNPDGLTASVTVKVKADYDPETTVKVTFQSQEDFKKFGSYYIADAEKEQAQRADAGRYWKISDGRLTRLDGDIKPDDALTSKVASLVYEGRKFQNFEMSIDYSHSTKTVWWPILLFGQQTPGAFFFQEGGGVAAFVQMDGIASLWGTDGKVSTDTGAVMGDKISGYNKDVLHNMKIRVVGKSLKMYVDGKLALEYTLPQTYNGYVGIMTNASTCSFDNFMVTNLDASGNPAPLEGSGSPGTGAADLPLIPCAALAGAGLTVLCMGRRRKK